VLKDRRIEACTSTTGIMCALAIDQGSSLTAALADAATKEGNPNGLSDDDRAAQFKTILAEHLSSSVSAILLDQRFGDACQAVCHDDTGILRGYETDVYDGDSNTVTTLPAALSVYRLATRGADAIKLHMYYDPDGDAAERTIKQALIERVGAECRAHELPFLFEPLAYRAELEPKTAAFAEAKPEIVRRSVEEFSKPSYCVDVLKIEFPVDLDFVAGSAALDHEPAYDKDEALDHYRATAAAAACPFVFLSAGVTLDQFAEGLELAGEAGVAYSGYLCGRAVWRPAIDIFGQGGPTALVRWAKEDGQARLCRLTEIADRTAYPMNAASQDQPIGDKRLAGGGPS
jgi:tagatose 1,6-diphosphate aldolase